MANFIVSYDLNGSYPTHQKMDNHIRSLTSNCARLLESVWWVEFYGTPAELFNKIYSVASPNDRLLVIEANDGCATNLLVPVDALKEAWKTAA